MNGGYPVKGVSFAVIWFFQSVNLNKVGFRIGGVAQQKPFVAQILIF